MDDERVNDLAWADEADAPTITELVRKLASEERQSSVSPKSKWLKICLSWAYETRDTLPDPLGTVEKIYADFDYPEEIESFVRYMPPADGYSPADHSHQENIDRLMKYWHDFITK